MKVSIYEYEGSKTKHCPTQEVEAMLKSFPVGTFGEAQPVGGESLQSISQQLHDAFSRCGVDACIISANRGVLFFKIISRQQLKLGLYGTEPDNIPRTNEPASPLF